MANISKIIPPYFFHLGLEYGSSLENYLSLYNFNSIYLDIQNNCQNHNAFLCILPCITNKIEIGIDNMSYDYIPLFFKLVLCILGTFKLLDLLKSFHNICLMLPNFQYIIILHMISLDDPLYDIHNTFLNHIHILQYY